MKTKLLMSITIAIMTSVGLLLIVSTISNNNIFVNTQQQPPKIQAPEQGTIFVFNEKSRPANEPEKCAALASVVKGKAVP